MRTIAVIISVAYYLHFPIQTNLSNELYLNNLANLHKKYDFILIINARNDKKTFPASVRSKFLNEFIYSQENERRKKHISYIDFLREYLYSKQSFKIKDYKINPFRELKIDTIMINQYKKEGLVYIIKKYTEPEKNHLISNTKTINTMDTLVYIMFQNQYYILFDSYSGEYHFLKKYKDFPKTL